MNLTLRIWTRLQAPSIALIEGASRSTPSHFAVPKGVTCECPFLESATGR
jgi:hypothetical protein